MNKELIKDWIAELRKQAKAQRELSHTKVGNDEYFCNGAAWGIDQCARFLEHQINEQWKDDGK